MTQNQRIIKYIRQYGSITQAEAANDLGCYRLGARIWELKRDGYKIKTDTVTYKNSEGNRVTFARYSLKEL